MSLDEALVKNSNSEVESTLPSKIRGLYDINDDFVDGDVDNSMFRDVKDGFLRFETKEECIEFIRKYCKIGSNPDFPYLQHLFTLLVTWPQIEKYLLNKIEYFNKKYPPKAAEPENKSWAANNVYAQKYINPNSFSAVNEGWSNFNSHKVLEGIKKSLNLPFHKCITPISTQNTLKYLFNHMRCGIYVMIRQNKLVMFVPFANKDYTNDWETMPKLDPDTPTLKEYYDKKSTEFRKENIISDFKQWWANGNIICNEQKRPGEKYSQYWGDQFLSALRDLLLESCMQRKMFDCEFFINKRDYPHLKYGSDLKPVEPYGFMFDKDDRDPKQDLPLKRHSYKLYTPIVSFYCSERFADIPFPTSEDWEAAVGMVYPKTFFHKNNQQTKEIEIDNPRDLFTQENFVKFKIDWEKKVNTAFFRGTATGGGVTAETNQRVKSASLSHIWKSECRYNGSDGSDPFLDSAITGWNKRDKKIFSEPMKYIKAKNFEFYGGKENFTPIYEQSKYKYLIYIEGHCAACRYGFMMRLGSVILKVDSQCVADLMWYFPLLQPMVDHVPVKADLSDLAERIQWCRENDDECRKIAKRAGELYDKFVHRSACLDYVQTLSHELSTRYRHYPHWINSNTDPIIPKPVAPPFIKLDKGHVPKCYENKGTAQGVFCSRCELEVKLERNKKEELMKSKEETERAKIIQKKNMRERMHQKAEKKQKTN